MRFSIQDKSILITGANRGIGKAILEAFLEQGAAKVYAAVRSPESVDPLIEKYGDKVVALRLDLTDPATITAAAEAASDVQMVVNNAGVLKIASPLSSEAVDSLKFEMEVNVYGLLRVVQAFAPVLKANGGGVLAQLNSVVSLKSFPDFATYAASKAASYSITQALRASLQEQGTRVLSIHPGPIDTDMGDQAGFEEIAEPPALIPQAMIAALAADDFHVFPDSMAKQVGAAYESFANNVIEQEMSEG